MLGVQYLNWYRYCKIVLVTEVTYCTVYRLCLEIEPAFVSTGKCKVLFSSRCTYIGFSRVGFFLKPGRAQFTLYGRSFPQMPVGREYLYSASCCCCCCCCSGWRRRRGLQQENLWLMCCEQEPEWEKRFWHLGHWKGFSPLWRRRCSVR